MKYYLLPLTLVSSLVFGESIVKNDDNLSITTLDAITVTALKNPRQVVDAPASVFVLNSQQIQEEMSGNVYDVLGDIPNVSIADRHLGFGRLAIRGATGPQIVLRVDGVRQNYTSEAGNARDTLMVDPDTLKDVEILLGPVSSLYGSGAIGGVISMSTKGADDMLKKDKNIGAEIKYIYHDKDKLNGQVYSVYGKAFEDKIKLILQQSMKDYGKVEYINGEKSDRDMDYDSTFFKSEIKFNDENSLNVSFKRFSNKLESRFDYDSTQSQYSAQYAYKPIDNNYINFSSNVYFLDRRDMFNRIMPTQTQRVHDSLKTFGLDLQNISSLDSFGRFTYGIEYYKDRQKSYPKVEGTDFSPNGTSDNYAGFLQGEFFVTDSFEIIPSVRYTKYKRDADVSINGVTYENQSDDDFSPAITLQYYITDNLNIFASYAKSFRAPTVNETFLNGYGDDIGAIGGETYTSWIIEPNPNLKPESSWGWQGGFGYSRQRVFANNDAIMFKATGFYQDVEDLISSYISVENSVMTSRYYNVAKANKKGYEIEAGYAIGNFSTKATYSHIKTKDKNSNEPLYQEMQPDRFTARFAYNIKPWDLKLWLKTNYSKKFVNYGKDMPHFTYHDVGLAYTPKNFLNGLEIFLGVNNLTNRKYREYNFGRGVPGDYAIGRNFRASFSYKF